jgi:RNA polymerase sigma-70 factor, ECF subfamily
MPPRSVPGKTDEEIVALVQQGNVEAFRPLVERYEPKIMRYAERFLFDRDRAKDLVQEVFIKAYVNIKSFDTKRRFSPWVYRIAHNEFVNAIKKDKREATVSLFQFDVLLPHPIAKETASGDLERREIKTLLTRSLAALDPKYREPLTLYYLEEMNYKEIADILRVPVSTVGIRLQRGKAALRKIVEGKQ